MDAARWVRIRSLFEEAIELAPAERPAYLDRTCGADAALRREVEGMIESESASSMFLSAPHDRLASAPPLDATGMRIGDFELLRLIASGGMGSVYEAVQDRPRRRVAFKMMRPSLAGDAGLKRFSVEVESLARLTHPNVAKIHEAGLHHGEAGLVLPWFAMEFVEDARSLRDYAVEKQLDREAVLELFDDVCSAVQHGHQKGVIHRDLKPGNLLVDPSGRVLVIDFGIALTAGESSEATRRTRAGELLGTLSYMSPEQFSGRPEDVDTRTDVYALGVILYELTCGRAPFDLDGAGIVEAARTVREDPPLDPRVANPDLPRELSWILLRALEKDPARRYASVAELAEDLRRLRHHEPVLAGPPTTTYRIAKFARRHRIGVLAGSVIGLLAVAGAVGLALWIRDRGRLLEQVQRNFTIAKDETARAREESERHAAVAGYLEDLLESANPYRMDGREVRMVDVLERHDEVASERFAGLPGVERSIRHTLGQTYGALGLREESLEQLTRAFELARETLPPSDGARIDIQRSLATSLAIVGRGEEALELTGSALEYLENTTDEVPERDLLIAWVSTAQATTLWQMGRITESEPFLRKSIEHGSRAVGAADPSVMVPRVKLIKGLIRMRRFDEVDELIEEGRRALAAADDPPARLSLDLDLAEAASYLSRREPAKTVELLSPIEADVVANFGEDSFDARELRRTLAVACELTGDLNRAKSLLETIIEQSIRLDGPDHPSTLFKRINLCSVLASSGQGDEAERQMVEIAAKQDEVLGKHHPETVRSYENLVRYSASVGRSTDEVLERSAAFLDRAELTPGLDTAGMLSGHLGLLRRLPPSGEVSARLQQLSEIQFAIHGNRHPDPSRTLLALGHTQRILGDTAEAELALRQAFENLEVLLPESEQDLGIAAGLLGQLLVDEEQWEEAASLLARATELAPIGDPWLFSLARDLVLASQHRDSTEGVALAVQRAGSNFEALGPDALPRYLDLVEQASALCAVHGQHEAVAALLEPALDLLEAGADPDRTAGLRLTLARSLHASGNSPAALDAATRAHESLEANFGAEDSRAVEAASFVRSLQDD